MAEKKDEPKAAPPARKGATGGDLGAAEVQRKMDKDAEQGCVGTPVDPTPNANYTVPGVISGAPTPETDPELKAEARAAAGFVEG